MYRKIYRQEGGLAEEWYRTQLRQAREEAIADWNRRTRGEVAERVGYRPRRAYGPVNIPLDTERQQGLSSILESKQPNIIERPTGFEGRAPIYAPDISTLSEADIFRTPRGYGPSPSVENIQPQLVQQLGRPADEVNYFRDLNTPPSGDLGLAVQPQEQALATGPFINQGQLGIVQQQPQVVKQLGRPPDLSNMFKQSDPTQVPLGQPLPVQPNMVEWTPPFIGGGMMPKTIMVPADEFGNPIPPDRGMKPVSEINKPRLLSTSAGVRMMRKNPETGNWELYTPPNLAI